MGNGNTGNGNNNANGNGKRQGFLSKYSSFIIPAILTALWGLGNGYVLMYLDTNYVPREEVETKYVKIYVHDTMDREVKKDLDALTARFDRMDEKEKKDAEKWEKTLEQYVQKDAYDIRMQSVQESLSRIEKALEDNNRFLRDLSHEHDHN